MTTIRFAVRSMLWCALAGPAAAQVHQVAFVRTASTTDHARIDTAVAASPSRVLIATNQRLELLDASNGNLIEGYDVRDSTGQVAQDFPLEPVGSPTGNLFVDPRVEWDPANERLWIMYTELTPPRLHFAVSRNASPQSFDEWDPVTETGDWYYYTGTDSINLDSTLILPSSLRFELADHPTMNVDDDFVYVALLDVDESTLQYAGAAVMIPLSHTGGSMLAGAKPVESDLGILQLTHLAPPAFDESIYQYAVQEPHEQVAGVQFFIATTEGPIWGDPEEFPRILYDGVQTTVRLCAAYLDAGEWKWIFRDLTLAQSDQFFNSAISTPDTPQSNWNVATKGSMFDSGVLARDGNGAFRIFAGNHAVTPDDPPEQTDFRYYVIDPDLAGFPGNWQPQLEVVGRAPIGNVVGGQTYHGAIGVNDEGTAYITFTRSGTQSPAGWPSLVRARLTSNYTAIQYEVSAGFQAGPEAYYVTGELGSDYADIQAAPDHCGFWTVGVLVDDPGEPATFVQHDKRAIWLTEIFACNTNAEMNGDGTVDAADLALYLEHFAKQTPQADMDGDGKIDSLDYLKYSDEYAKR